MLRTPATHTFKTVGECQIKADVYEGRGKESFTSTAFKMDFGQTK